MRQSRLVSLIEVCVNVATGFVIAMAVWLYVIPFFWPHHASPVSEGFAITAVFTVASILRGYVWRRFFENEVHKTIVNWVGRCVSPAAPGGRKSASLD